MTRCRFRSNFPLATMATLCAGIAAWPTGCRTAAKPIFEAPSTTIVWPPPPQPPRIRYIGELRTSDDLKPARRGLQGLGEFLVGKKAPSPLYGPRGVAVTADGQRVWIADPGGRCLHLFDLERRTYLKVEKVGATHFLTPVAVVPGPEGSIYVCDSEQAAIYRLDDLDGRPLDVLQLPEELLRPAAIHFDAQTDELFVVDVTGHDLKVLARDGGLRRVMGSRGSRPGEFNFPTAIASDGERLWIADSGNHRVQAVSYSGEPIVSFGQAGDAPGDLALPKSVALDPAGHVYIVDGRFENVQIFDAKGQLLLFFGEEGSGPGEFWLPGGIFIEPGGRIWVCDAYNGRVQVFQYVRGDDDAR